MAVGHSVHKQIVQWLHYEPASLVGFLSFADGDGCTHAFDCVGVTSLPAAGAVCAKVNVKHLNEITPQKKYGYNVSTRNV